MEKHSDAVLVTCGSRYVGPDREFLFDVVQESSCVHAQLLSLNPAVVRGPSHHGSTFFSRAAYQNAGGYRSSFYFAQDLDLWIRLAEYGRCIAISEILVEVAITVEGISSQRKKEQARLTGLAIESARLRRNGLSDSAILKCAAAIKPADNRAVSRKKRAKALYFIGSCLARQKRPESRDYFRKAIFAYPLHARSLVRFALAAVGLFRMKF